MTVEIGKTYWHDQLGKVKVINNSTVSRDHVKVELCDSNKVYHALEHCLIEIPVNKYPKEMLVWDDLEDQVNHKTVLGYIPDQKYPYITKEKNDPLYKYTGYKHAKDIQQQTELSMQEIADKFNISVEQLKIKK